jgi:hypothetical protein
VDEETSVDERLGIPERYLRLDGVVFRVRLDRLDTGAQYLRHGTWVWTPITSGSVLRNPHSRQLSTWEVDGLRERERSASEPARSG